MPVNVLRSRARTWTVIGSTWLLAHATVVLGAEPPPATAPAAAPPAAPPAAGAVATAPDRTQRWREDIDACVNGLLARHKNATHSVSAEVIRSAGERLKAQIETFSDARLNLGIMAIAALVGDAHTTASLGAKGVQYHALPLDVAWMKDGLFILAAREEDRALLGAKIVAIGGVGIDEVERRLGTVISHENTGWVRQQARPFIKLGEVLHALDLAPTPDAAEFTILRPGSEREERVTLSILKPGDRPKTAAAVDIAAPTFASTLRPREGGRWYGHRLIDATKTLYIWYDRCQDQPQQPSVSAWTQDVFKVIDEQKPARIIIDLRRNGGGNSVLLGVLELGLAQRQQQGAAWPVRVLIGRGTFSSGMMNAVELKNLCKATLIGSPTGGKPNAYGEVQSFTLPHSGITVSYCTKLFKRWPSDEDAVPVDIEVESTWADLLAGRDVVMERAEGE